MLFTHRIFKIVVIAIAIMCQANTLVFAQDNRLVNELDSLIFINSELSLSEWRWKYFDQYYNKEISKATYSVSCCNENINEQDIVELDKKIENKIYSYSERDTSVVKGFLDYNKKEMRALLLARSLCESNVDSLWNRYLIMEDNYFSYIYDIEKRTEYLALIFFFRSNLENHAVFFVNKICYAKSERGKLRILELYSHADCKIVSFENRLIDLLVISSCSNEVLKGVHYFISKSKCPDKRKANFLLRILEFQKKDSINTELLLKDFVGKYEKWVPHFHEYEERVFYLCKFYYESKQYTSLERIMPFMAPDNKTVDFLLFISENKEISLNKIESQLSRISKITNDNELKDKIYKGSSSTLKTPE